MQKEKKKNARKEEKMIFLCGGGEGLKMFIMLLYNDFNEQE